MAHFKRRHPRRWVRCGICTPGRQGNSQKSSYGHKRLLPSRQLDLERQLDDWAVLPTQWDYFDWDDDFDEHDRGEDSGRPTELVLF